MGANKRWLNVRSRAPGVVRGVRAYARGARSLPEGRRRAPRERSDCARSDERSRPHPAEPLAGGPQAQISGNRVATLKFRADIERSLQAGLRLPEVRQFREVPMEPETEDVELESIPVGGFSIDQLVRARVPEPEL